MLGLPLAATAQTIDLANGGSERKWSGVESNSHAGGSLDLGQVSAHGSRDLIIGAPGGEGRLGRVYVMFGGSVASRDLSLADAHTVITGRDAGDLFGFSTAAGNIWNLEDAIPRALLVGAPNSGAGNTGRAYLYRGGFGVGDSLDTSQALLEIRGVSSDSLGYAFATGDLNGDGYREMIIGAPGNNRVYVIAGGPGLHHTGPMRVMDLATTPALMTISGVGIGRVLAAGDLTGDGRYDLAIGAPTSNMVHIIVGRPSGSPLPATWDLASRPADITLYGSDAGDRFGGALRVTDLDGDQRRDLIVGAPGGDGPGESRPDGGEVYGFAGPSIQQLAAVAPSVRAAAAAEIRFYGMAAGHAAGTSFTAGDINRDSPHNDLVIYAPGARAAGEWLIYYGRNRNLIGTADPSGVRIVDLSASGQVDRSIVGDPAQGQVTTAQVFEITGEGARDVVVGVPGSDGGAGAVHVTLSPRLALSAESVSVTLIVNAGQSFAHRIRVVNVSTVPITWGTAAQTSWLSASPSAGSASEGNDGVFDLIASAGTLAPGTYTGTLQVFSTSPHLEMRLPVTVTMHVAPPTREPGDFSGDGGYDIIWQHGTQGWLSLWRMNGTTLVAGESLQPDRVADTNWKVVGTGDFNGDGHPDLLWHHQTQGWLSTWLMNGRQQVTGTSLLPDRVTDTNWKVVGTGDFNGDGRRDILWQHATERLLSVWLMNGTRLQDGRLLSPDRVASTAWSIVGTGDFNGDGRTDILWQDSVQGGLSVWFMNGTTMTSGVWLSPSHVTDLGWKVRAVADVNRDGRPDIIWQHTASGALAAWLMNGVTMMRGLELSPGSVPDTAWKIVGPK